MPQTSRAFVCFDDGADVAGQYTFERADAFRRNRPQVMDVAAQHVPEQLGLAAGAKQASCVFVPCEFLGDGFGQARAGLYRQNGFNAIANQ
ncbi:hypothetical protein GY15_31025 [Delftia sp. 670]|nr:hypothetical protein GY15_31025 [Delftia sp. 670]